MITPNQIRHLGWLGSALVGAAVAAVSSQAFRDTNMWRDHWPDIVSVCVDFGTLLILATYMVAHSWTTAQMKKDINAIGSRNIRDEKEIAYMEGLERERTDVINRLITRQHKMADRTVELKTAAEILAGALQPIEDRMHIARSRALERLQRIFVEQVWIDDGIPTALSPPVRPTDSGDPE
jgi:hypothetical protein